MPRLVREGVRPQCASELRKHFTKSLSITLSLPQNISFMAPLSLGALECVYSKLELSSEGSPFLYYISWVGHVG